MGLLTPHLRIMSKSTPTSAIKPTTERISDDELLQMEQLERLSRKAKDAFSDHFQDLARKYGLGEGDSISWNGRIHRAPKAQS
jgi:hypothetical protein